ncbi:MAG TPA: ABC transporter ATP-binding protein [Chthoniobacterales bacterium]
MASVEVQGLTKWYGKRRGVEDVSFTVHDKEFLAIFGPAGAGKTTTLNLISGTVTPNQGSVRIGGKSIDGLEPAERNVAMVFESYALYPQLSVFENMAFPLKSPKFKVPEAEVKQRVMRVAQVMKIDHLLDRKIQALSNGQRQRTALGRALVRNPQVFLLDEPLSHLDAKLRHLMRAELKEMRQQLGTTTIYVTHDYLEAMSLGDRIVILSDGRVQQIGTPDEVYFRPANTAVARLFGDPEINLVEASVQKSAGDRLTLQMFGEKGTMPVPREIIDGLRASAQPKLLVGFRPADVELRTAGNGQTDYTGVVYSFEPLGTKSIVTLDGVDGTRVRALVDGRNLYEPDRRIQFALRPERLIFFDPETKQFLGREEKVGTGVE